MNKNWIKSDDRLPQEGKYVLARHIRGTWMDSTDQENVNCVVVKLVKGISKQDRELMKSGNLPTYNVGSIGYDGSFDKPIYNEIPRYKVYKEEDEDGNNLKPYCWETFGADTFFGQDITHWMPIEPLNYKD